MLAPGQVVAVAVEKPAAGGAMIARLDGRVVLVSGAIPGERVRARIVRVGKGVAYADIVAVDEPSADRRRPTADPRCGGGLYAHIAYPRQLALKGQVIADAFTRIGRAPLPSVPGVAASPEEGYRMRARLHLRSGHARAGFFREGTHDICDARATGQLLASTSDAIDRLSDQLRAFDRDGQFEIEVSENIPASQRTVHIDAVAPIDARALATLGAIDGLTGLTLSTDARAPEKMETVGDPSVVDVLTIDGHPVTLRRHVRAFFQGNRHLLGDLVSHVIGSVDQASEVVDLYAGVGVFAVAAAVVRAARVVAVEGDQVAATDLEANARTAGASIESIHQSVEVFTDRWRPAVAPDMLIVDPPRTGMSKDALEGAIRLRPRQVTYVSCDVATLARDTRRLLDAGYALRDVVGFDLFPNTPHVETVARFERV